LESFEFLKKEFGTLTRVQEKAIPVIASGEHVLVVAGTGEGKTETAVLPLLEKSQSKQGMQVVYITPLKALNRDLTNRISRIGKEFNITVSVRHGDTSQYERSKQLKNPPNLLVTTPESLAAMLSAPKMSENFSSVKHVVVDEAHELYSNKRGTLLSVLLERLVQKAGEFQRVLLSATVPNPKALAEYFFGNRTYTVIKPPASKKPVLSVEIPSVSKDDRALAKTINTPAEVIARARRIMSVPGPSICFVNTRSTSELLASRIKALSGNASVHHSSLGKEERHSTELMLKQGELDHVIATSSLELGIDIGRINEIVQYSSPRQVHRLVQRVGRSGHSRTGVPKGTIIALTPFDALESGVICELALEGFLEDSIPPEKPYDVAAIQSAGISLSGGHPSSEIFSVFKRSSAYRELSQEEFERVLNQLDSEGILRLFKEVVRPTRLTRKYYYENLSVIPDEKKLRVKDVSTGRTIAVLDEAFVEGELYDKNVFIVKGQPWKVLEVTEKEVFVEPRTDYSAVIPAWEGENIPVSKEVAERVRQVVAGERNLPKAIRQKQEIEKFLQDQRSCFLPEKRRMWLENTEDFFILHSFLGTKANNTLAQYAGFLMSEYLGRSVSVSCGAYHIAFQGMPDASLIIETLSGKPALSPVLKKAVKKTGAYQHRLLHVARRFGALKKESRVKSLKKLVRVLSNTVIEEEAVKEVFHAKFDLKTASEILRDLHHHRIKLEEYSGKTSPLAFRVFSEELRIPDLILPSRPLEQIIEGVKKVLDEKIVLFYCTYCKKKFYRKVSDLPDKIKCPYCDSTQIALIKRERMSEVMEKKRRSAEEKEFVRGVLDTVPVIDSYGKKGVYTLLMKGIGPSTAKRTLARSRNDEKRFWRDLLEAQRDYYRNRQYWE